MGWTPVSERLAKRPLVLELNRGGLDVNHHVGGGVFHASHGSSASSSGSMSTTTSHSALSSIASSLIAAHNNPLDELQSFLLEDSSVGTVRSSSPEAVPLPGPMRLTPSQDLSLDIFPTDMDLTLLDTLCEMVSSPRKSTAFWGEESDPLAMFGEGAVPGGEEWGWFNPPGGQGGSGAGFDGFGAAFVSA
jgi:hypothetical protein